MTDNPVLDLIDEAVKANEALLKVLVDPYCIKTVQCSIAWLKQLRVYVNRAG